MAIVNVLDCTLRDGGYCNNWEFGEDSIKGILGGLSEAKLEFVECGFLKNNAIIRNGRSVYSDINQISRLVPEICYNTRFLLMINYGEYDIIDMPHCNGSIWGIRVAFHKKDMNDALQMCKAIKEKGYNVFVQPMVTLNYSDDEFIELIKMVNVINPYAMYIVDSFGAMGENDINHYRSLVEAFLDENISVGLHAHNNMQLAFSNAQAMIKYKAERCLLIDSSVYGMGRGAGNLNTELIVDYINGFYNNQYKLRPVLKVIDEIVLDIYRRNYWGYSFAYYISARNNVHPNYAKYLDDKRTLNIESFNEIFELMDDEKKSAFDSEYIEKLYKCYMARVSQTDAVYERLEKLFSGKTVLLIAPGKSSVEEKERIVQFIKDNKNIVSMGVNFDYGVIKTDLIFSSNIRRFWLLNSEAKSRTIITTNIISDLFYELVDYKDLLGTRDVIVDNSGIMAIRLLIKCGAVEIFLAGFDGYSHDAEQNYGQDSMILQVEADRYDKLNEGMNAEIKQLSRNIKISHLTKIKYIGKN